MLPKNTRKLCEMLIRISIFLAIMLSSVQSENFEPSKFLCQRCQCTYQGQQNETLVINCTNTNMLKVIADWPQTDAKNLVATFSYNNITDLQQMPQTTAESVSVSYSHCNVQEVSVELFVNCLNIKYFDLSHNLIESEQLTGDIFKGQYNEEYFEPLGLRGLNLAYNKLIGLRAEVFEHIPDLEDLNLEGNHIRVLDLNTCAALSRLKKLQVLNLANNKLTEIPNDSIKDLESLRELDISYNELDTVPECITYAMRTLEVLKINDNPIITLSDQTFLGMRQLRFLNLSSLGHLKSIDANTFSELQSLRELHLTNNKHLMEIHEEAFGILRTNDNWQLHEVHLNDNALKSLPVELMPWSELNVLTIEGNPFDCTCDLYTIAQQLSNSSKIGMDSTLCTKYNWDEDDYSTYSVYDLTNQTCGKTPFLTKTETAQMYASNNIKIMRVMTTTTIIIILFSIVIAITLVAYKYKKYKRSKNSQYPIISYDRLSNNSRF